MHPGPDDVDSHCLSQLCPSSRADRSSSPSRVTDETLGKTSGADALVVDSNDETGDELGEAVAAAAASVVAFVLGLDDAGAGVPFVLGTSAGRLLLLLLAVVSVMMLTLPSSVTRDAWDRMFGSS